MPSSMAQTQLSKLDLSPDGRAHPISATGRYINGLAFKPSDWGDEGLLIIRIQNLTNPCKPMNRTTRQVDPIYVVQRGDLLVSWSATLDAFIWDREPAVLNQHIFKVVPNAELVSKRYLFYALRRAIAELIKTEHLHGSTMKHINRAPFLAHMIYLPSLTEQAQIVAEIEKQFSRLDEAVANLKRVKANLKRYKAAVLKAAVEGRLVPTEAELAEREGREFETGDQLLQQILETRRAMFIGKGRYKEPETGRAEWQYALPAGWTWVTLGQLALSVKDGPHYSPAYSDQGIPFISGGNIRPEGVDFTLTKYISPQLHAELSKRCKPEQGDLLYTKGGTTGIARINTESREFNVWVHVAVLKLTKFVQPFYVQHALNSQHCYRQAQQYTHGVGNQDLGLTRMVWITMPLPPLAEQHRIVAEVDRHLSIVREVESEVDANLKRAETLRQAVLARAFAPTGTTGAGQSEQAVAPA